VDSAGFAHGFYTLSETADLIYKVTDYYAPEWEHTLIWSDPQVNIAWPLIDGQPPVLSPKTRGRHSRKPKCLRSEYPSLSDRSWRSPDPSRGWRSHRHQAIGVGLIARTIEPEQLSSPSRHELELGRRCDPCRARHLFARNGAGSFCCARWPFTIRRRCAPCSPASCSICCCRSARAMWFRDLAGREPAAILRASLAAC